MNRAIALLALVGLILFLPPMAAASDRLDPANLEVGQVGTLTNQSKELWQFEVVEVIDKGKAVLRLPGGRMPAVLIREWDTAGLADGKRLTLPGTWKVVGTEKVAGRTYFALEKQKD